MTATTIILSGPLGKKFGREYRLHLDTKTPAEATRALCWMLPGFKAYLAGAQARGVAFAVFRGKGKSAENITVHQLHEPAGDVIRFAPVIVGSKNGGVLNVIVGVVLIVIGGLITGWSFGAATPVGTAIAGVGLSMIAGGIVQMLSPQPKLNKGGADSAANQASYVFSGAVNTTAQGNPVPVLYGRMIVGSAVISAGIEADEYSTAANGVGAGTPGGNFKRTPYDPDL
jgi:predicted phage tail protein